MTTLHTGSPLPPKLNIILKTLEYFWFNINITLFSQVGVLMLHYDKFSMLSVPARSRDSRLSWTRGGQPLQPVSTLHIPCNGGNCLSGSTRLTHTHCASQSTQPSTWRNIQRTSSACSQSSLSLALYSICFEVSCSACGSGVSRSNLYQEEGSQG